MAATGEMLVTVDSEQKRLENIDRGCAHRIGVIAGDKQNAQRFPVSGRSEVVHGALPLSLSRCQTGVGRV
jgi:hypothetical protein